MNKLLRHRSLTIHFRTQSFFCGKTAPWLPSHGSNAVTRQVPNCVPIAFPFFHVKSSLRALRNALRYRTNTRTWKVLLQHDVLFSWQSTLDMEGLLGILVSWFFLTQIIARVDKAAVILILRQEVSFTINCFFGN